MVIKEEKLEKITKEEYEESIENQVLYLRNELNKAISTYNQYCSDKERYILKYLKKGNVYMYMKNPRQPIGFRQKNK